ncbi:hypothetical protein [uncultured Methanobrevibacter sp.]|uniref:hypothetical protein n=1 Tax=Methanobrevibacter sp. TaxID=66852 RepID=UPI003209E280
MGIICIERYLAMDVGGTVIKYVMTDKSAEISKINEMKTNRKVEELFNSLDEIISPNIDDRWHCNFLSWKN